MIRLTITKYSNRNRNILWTRIKLSLCSKKDMEKVSKDKKNSIVYILHNYLRLNKIYYENNLEIRSYSYIFFMFAK